MTEYMTENAVVRIHGTVNHTRLKEAAETYIKQVERLEKRRCNGDSQQDRSVCGNDTEHSGR